MRRVATSRDHVAENPHPPADLFADSRHDKSAWGGNRATVGRPDATARERRTRGGALDSAEADFTRRDSSESTSGAAPGDGVGPRIITQPAFSSVVYDAATGAWTYTPGPGRHSGRTDRFTDVVSDSLSGAPETVRIDMTVARKSLIRLEKGASVEDGQTPQENLVF